jgi:hypothetical protein
MKGSSTGNSKVELPIIGAPGVAAESLEQSDDRLCRASELAEYGHDWLHRKKVGFVERYLSGDQKIVIRRVDVGPPYDGAILEARPHRRKLKSLPVRRRRDDEVVGREMDADKLFVFPLYVEVVESEEQIIPSTVRLQSFDDFKVDVGQPLFSFCHVLWVGKRINGRIDGEMAIGTRRLSVPYGDGGCEQVKARSGTVDDCANISVGGGGKLPIDLKLKELLAHFRVRLFNEQIGVTLEPGFEFLFEGWELGSGPIDSGIRV